MSEKKCPDCYRDMEKGFIVDVAKDVSFQTMWYGGQEESIEKHGFIEDFDTLDKSKLSFVETYRCTACGLLKSYATFNNN